MGVGAVERTSIDECGIKLCEPCLQLVRYESFVDARCEVRDAMTLRNRVLTWGRPSRECRPMDVTVQLTDEDIGLLVEALDAYEYWEGVDRLPRNNGSVFIPGDLRPEDDRYWGPTRSPNDAELEAIELVRACRELADRLSAVFVPDAER